MKIKLLRRNQNLKKKTEVNNLTLRNKYNFDVFTI